MANPCKDFWDELWKWEKGKPHPGETITDPYLALSLAQEKRNARKKLEKAKAAKKPDTKKEEKKLKDVCNRFAKVGRRVAKKLGKLLPQKGGKIDWKEFRRWVLFGLDPKIAGGSGNKPIIDLNSLYLWILFVQEWLKELEEELDETKDMKAKAKKAKNKVQENKMAKKKKQLKEELKLWKKYACVLLEIEIDRLKKGKGPTFPPEILKEFEAKKKTLTAMVPDRVGTAAHAFAVTELSHPLLSEIHDDVLNWIYRLALGVELVVQPSVFVVNRFDDEEHPIPRRARRGSGRET